MSEMPLNNYLQKRGSTYQFRIRVPADIVGFLGRREIKASLKTRDPAEARRLAKLKAVETENLFASFRVAHLGGSRPKLPIDDVTFPNVTALEYYQRIRSDEEEGRRRVFNLVAADVDGFLAGKYIEHPMDEGYMRVTQDGDWKQLLSYCFKRQTLNRLRDIQRSRAVSDMSGHLTQAAGSSTVARALMDAEIKALEHIITNVHPDPFSDQANAEFATSPRQLAGRDIAPALSVASEEWLRVKAKVWPEKTVRSRRAFINQFVSVAGDKPINLYGKGDVRRFMKVLEVLPPNWSKNSRLNQMGIIAAADEATRLGLAPTKPKNVNNIMTSCSSCFAWLMKNHDDLNSNPFSGIKVEFREDIRAARDSFSSVELCRIFQSAEFNKLGRDSAKHWVPLIALYTGMRASEICQLYVTDVRREDGISYFDNNLDHPDKRLKTSSSKRRSPIHQQLELLGFLDFVERRKKAGSVRLFPDVAMAADGYYSTIFSKWFSRFLRSLGIKREKITFHSFRHTFEDAARSAKIDHAVMNALQGHSEGDMSDRYGSQYPLIVLNDAMQKISYPKLVERIVS
jgi:integrase